MGALEGVEGLFVGDRVGLRVVGALEGVEAGLFVRDRVGLRVGVNVGLPVGATVGLKVGLPSYPAP